MLSNDSRKPSEEQPPTHLPVFSQLVIGGTPSRVYRGAIFRSSVRGGLASGLLVVFSVPLGVSLRVGPSEVFVVLVLLVVGIVGIVSETLQIIHIYVFVNSFVQ